MRQPQGFTSLQSSQQHSGFDPARGAEWWGLNLTMEPNQRFVSSTHGQQYMSVLTYNQVAPDNLTMRCSVRRSSSRRLQPEQAARRLRAAADRER